MPQCTRLVSLGLALWLIEFSTAHADDWPRFRGPRGDGSSRESLAVRRDGPELVWKTSVGDGAASLAIRDNRLYTLGSVAGRGAHLWCLDASTGRVLWQQPTDCWYQNSTPTISDGLVFVLATPQNQPVAFCFRAATGDPVWRRDLPKPPTLRDYGHAGSPLLWEDLVILNVGTGTALRRHDGEVVWQHAGIAGLATPVLYREAGQDRVMIFAGEALIARDPRTGRELWSIPWKTELAVNACDPIYHDGKVFISTDYGKHAALFDVSRQPPQQLWKESGAVFSSGILRDGFLYCFSGPRFSCLDFATGQRRWNIPEQGKGSVLLAGDKLILLSEKGRLSIAPMSPQSFTPIIQTEVLGGTTWVPPALANSRLYVRNTDGDLICLQIADRK